MNPLSPRPRTVWEEAAKTAGLRPKDLAESFIRAPGPGGQNVNKVSTCVVLEHLPTGTVVRVATERYREQNRRAALVRLAEKLREAREARLALVRDERELERRRKRPRPRKLKAALRSMKKHRAERKAARNVSNRDTE